MAIRTTSQSKLHREAVTVLISNNKKSQLVRISVKFNLWAVLEQDKVGYLMSMSPSKQIIRREVVYLLFPEQEITLIQIPTTHKDVRIRLIRWLIMVKESHLEELQRDRKQIFRHSV